MAVQYASRSADHSTGDGAGAAKFCAFVRSLPAKPSETIRLFNRKDFWSAYGDDAVLIATNYYKTTAVLKFLGGSEADGGLAAVSLSRGMFEDTVRDLLTARRCKIDLYSPSSGGAWTHTATASPGNMAAFEDILSRSRGGGGGDGGAETALAGRTTIAVRLGRDATGRRTLGVATIDVPARRLGVAALSETDALGNFESVLVQYAATEVVISAGTADADRKKIIGIAELAGVLVTERKSAEFGTGDVEALLGRLLRPAQAPMLAKARDMPDALACLAALLSYMDTAADTAMHGKFTLESLALGCFMRLDSAAVAALNLLPAHAHDKSSSSIFGVLNRCRTAAGSRLLLHWLRQPLTDCASIEARLDLVECFVRCGASRQALSDTSLKHVPDLGRLASKLMRGKATLQDLVRLYQLCVRLPDMARLLGEAAAVAHGALVDARLVAPMRQCTVDLQKFTELVETTIDLDLIDKHEYLINPQFDGALTQLRSALDAIAGEASAVAARVEAELGLAGGGPGSAKKGRGAAAAAGGGVKLEKNAAMGYYLRVTRKEESRLRNKPQFETLDTKKDGVKFTTRDLRRLSAEHLKRSEEYESHQKALESKVISIAASYANVFEELAAVLAEVDVFVALACAAISAPVPYCRPSLRSAGAGDIVLSGARHPCVEAQDGLSFIANDVSLRRADARFQIITGPNMGGKSTYIRQVGAIVLMAQIGSFVPCTSAQIALVDAILARVGAGDSQLRGVSTFMAEMLETAAILQTATERSLVIIDELGRGTSTYDGFGLAWAISERLARDTRALCLFATHFHELTALADAVPGVANLHVSALATATSLTLLYQVRPGPCDRSFGIHVAELAAFPPVVVATAKRKAAELEDFDAADAQGSGAVAQVAKRRRICAAPEDEAALRSFISAAAAVPMDTQPEPALAKLVELRQALAATESPFIASLIASARDQ